ncbi:MAG: hypothetical protein IJE46_06900 [Clostridia bacterium]|nr:hypothetical protein [Clostridia bacterium]
MKKVNVKRLAVFTIIIVLLLALLVNIGSFLFSVIAGMKITDTGTTITPSVVSEHDFEQYNGALAVVNSKGIEFYNNKGEYNADIAFKLYTPYIYTSDKYAVVADVGAENAIVLKNGKQAYKISEKEPIYSVSVNQNGYTAVLTSESGYKSTVVIYNNLGSKIYTWYSGDLYVVDVKISDNNKRFAIAGVLADDNLKSVVKFFKLNEENPVSEVILDSELAYQLEYKNSKALIATDSGLRLVSQNGKIKKKYDFTGHNLLCFDIKNTKMPTVAISNSEGSGSKVVVLNSSLREKGVAVIDGQAEMIDENNSKIIVSNSNKVYLVSQRGNVKAVGDMFKDAQSIKLADDNKHIFTLSGSTLGIYKIEYGRN